MKHLCSISGSAATARRSTPNAMAGAQARERGGERGKRRLSTVSAGGSAARAGAGQGVAREVVADHCVDNTSTHTQRACLASRRQRVDGPAVNWQRTHPKPQPLTQRRSSAPPTAPATTRLPVTTRRAEKSAEGSGVSVSGQGCSSAFSFCLSAASSPPPGHSPSPRGSPAARAGCARTCCLRTRRELGSAVAWPPVSEQAATVLLRAPPAALVYWSGWAYSARRASPRVSSPSTAAGSVTPRCASNASRVRASCSGDSGVRRGSAAGDGAPRSRTGPCGCTTTVWCAGCACGHAGRLSQRAAAAAELARR